MKFLEDTGKNWAAVQIRAVEMEIEQQKRDWEEKRQAQRQQEELEKQRADNEENEILTYSRDDALNKVNITPKKKFSMLGKRKSESAIGFTKSNAHGKKNNGTETTQNGISKETEKKDVKSSKTPLKVIDVPRRNTRNSLNRSVGDEKSFNKMKARRSTISQRATSRKSDRSTSIQSRKSHTRRSTSESTSRSAADSSSRQTSSNNASPEDSDSECSLDVMIDSNDVNDSDSNSNQNNVNEKVQSRLDSTSVENDMLLNDDSTMSDETAIEKASKNSTNSNNDSKVASSPRTRSRGTVNVNLWTLDESSPILPVKRQKSSNKKSEQSKQKEEKQIRSSFGVRECKVAIVDIKTKSPALHHPDSSLLKPSPKSRAPKKLFTVKNNHTLDKWIQKPSEPLIDVDSTPDGLKDESERIPITRQRRHTIMSNKTL